MILCCGEALIDMLPAPTAQGTEGFVPHCGGAIMNTAVALGRLGAEVGLFTGVSKDRFGQQLIDHLKASQVDLSYVVRPSRNTTLAFVHLENGQARYSFYNENTADRMLDVSILPDLPSDVTALFFGGISLITEPAADTYAAFLEKECDGRVVMMDPNIRENFISDAQRYRARLERMLCKTHIVKVSDEDLDWLHPGPAHLEEKARLLLASGPSVVVVTQGAKGATAFLKNGAVVSVAAQPVKVVDTVGAGDTFNAGFLHKLNELQCLHVKALRDLPVEVIEQAVTFGSKVAGISISRHGANPPWANELG